MRRPLVAYRLRFVFRGAFFLLALATVAMAAYVLNDEKQRGLRDYRYNFVKTKDQIAARLRHPAGQLALLNPRASSTHLTPLAPVRLPFAAIDFDDENKVRAKVLALRNGTGDGAEAGPLSNGFEYGCFVRNVAYGVQIEEALTSTEGDLGIFS